MVFNLMEITSRQGLCDPFGPPLYLTIIEWNECMRTGLCKVGAVTTGIDGATTPVTCDKQVLLAPSNAHKRK